MESEIVPFSTEQRDYHMEDMLTATLNALCQGQTYLYAYTGREPTYMEAEWCDYELFSKETAQKPDSASRSDARRGDGYVFDVSDTALFVSMPNGERLYVDINKD